MQVASLCDRIHPSPFWACHNREQTIPHNPSFNHPQANAPSTPSHSFLNHNGETPPPSSFSAQQMRGYSYRNQQPRHPHMTSFRSLISSASSFQRNGWGSILYVFILFLRLIKTGYTLFFPSPLWRKHSRFFWDDMWDCILRCVHV